MEEKTLPIEEACERIYAQLASSKYLSESEIALLKQRLEILENSR